MYCNPLYSSRASTDFQKLVTLHNRNVDILDPENGNQIMERASLETEKQEQAYLHIYHINNELYIHALAFLAYTLQRLIEQRGNRRLTDKERTLLQCPTYPFRSCISICRPLL